MSERTQDGPEIGDNAGAQLRSIVERIERINVEIGTYNDDKKEVFAEAKSTGFDTKIIKRIVQMRKTPKAERAEADAILETYLQALGEI